MGIQDEFESDSKPQDLSFESAQTRPDLLPPINKEDASGYQKAIEGALSTAITTAQATLAQQFEKGMPLKIVDSDFS